MSTEMNGAFDKAFQSFLEALPEKERKRYSPCSSAQDLLDGLSKLDVMSKKLQKAPSNRVVKGIKTFSVRLQPYFAIIDVFIQSNPTYAAIIWGSLRLVLQVWKRSEHSTSGLLTLG